MSECEDSSPIPKGVEWNTRRTRRQGYEMIGQLKAQRDLPTSILRSAGILLHNHVPQGVPQGMIFLLEGERRSRVCRSRKLLNVVRSVIHSLDVTRE